MTRLTISYHNDTNEPVAVQTIGDVIISAPWSRDTGSHASRNTLAEERALKAAGRQGNETNTKVEKRAVHQPAARVVR